MLYVGDINHFPRTYPSLIIGGSVFTVLLYFVPERCCGSNLGLRVKSLLYGTIKLAAFCLWENFGADLGVRRALLTCVVRSLSLTPRQVCCQRRLVAMTVRMTYFVDF